VREFSTEVTVPRNAAEARALALDKLGSGLEDSGYELIEKGTSALTFHRKSAFWWPLNKLSGDSTVRMTFEDQGGGKTRMVVAGTAPRAIARDFETLSDE
jgi:hypothetical protein